MGIVNTHWENCSFCFIFNSYFCPFYIIWSFYGPFLLIRRKKLYNRRKDEIFLSLLRKLRISRVWALRTKKKSCIKSEPDKIAHLLALACPFWPNSKTSKKASRKLLFCCKIAQWLCCFDQNCMLICRALYLKIHHLKMKWKI